MGFLDILLGGEEKKPDDIPVIAFDKPKKGITSIDLNVRTGPGINFKRIRTMKTKTEVAIYGTCEYAFEVWYWLGGEEYCSSDSAFIKVEEIKKVSATDSINDDFPYKLTKTVFSDKEAIFYHALLPITTKLNLTVFTKMRVADLLWLPKNHPEYIRWFNYIRSKHIDFVLCNKDLEPVLLIEIDDNTHNSDKRKKRDEFIDKVFEKLNLPIIHTRRWQNEELENQIKESLNI